jgi:hypothetical protein
MFRLSLFLTQLALLQEDVWGSGFIDPCFLDLDTIWEREVSFTAMPLYLRRKSPWYACDRRLGGPHRRSGLYGKVKILNSTETRIPAPRSSSQ